MILEKLKDTMKKLKMEKSKILGEEIIKLSNYGASVMGILLVCIFVEFLSFMKWYISCRKKITSNSLQYLTIHYESLKEKQQKQNSIRLNSLEKALIVIL